MQFDWTTFALELVNFFVLLWVLKRLFYRPVMAALDARQQRLHAESAHAGESLRSAESLKQLYEARLGEWNREREGRLRVLDEEIVRERQRRLEAVQAALAAEEERARARAGLAASSQQAALTRKATQQAYAAAAAMLRRLACPALTARIATVFVEDLAALAGAELAALRNAAARLDGDAVEVTSAHELDAATREAIATALSRATGVTLAVSYKTHPELLAGLRAVVGECLLQASLDDELALFREHDARA